MRRANKASKYSIENSFDCIVFGDGMRIVTALVGSDAWLEPDGSSALAVQAGLSLTMASSALRWVGQNRGAIGSGSPKFDVGAGWFSEALPSECEVEHRIRPRVG